MCPRRIFDSLRGFVPSGVTSRFLTTSKRGEAMENFFVMQMMRRAQEAEQRERVHHASGGRSAQHLGFAGRAAGS